MLELVGNRSRSTRTRSSLEWRDRDWETVTFERPVRLRDRVPVPPRGPTIAAGSALAAVGTGFAVYMWLRRRSETARA
jgi:hypothetical protein